MKYDEKTGKEIPESRMDEIKVSIDRLQKLSKETNGMIDKAVERNVVLMDISVSLGLLVDICGAIYNKLIDSNAESH